MQSLAFNSDRDYYTRAANEDCINGGPRTRTKYAYDANGNVTSRNGNVFGWNSYNYPGGVTTATESATFDYGPNHQRWRMIYTGSSGNETTFYATPKFEKVYAGGGGEYRSYIYAGNRPVVVVMRNTAGAINVRSLLVDHQGSISSVVTDSTGASLVSESFTAYGNRREASTWTGTPTSGELTTMNGVTREGYTFQTVLGSMGLNHMNGRIEDSVTGRFISPDPRGTIRGNTQSWNRYSYVLNNPVTNTDPSGFCATARRELKAAANLDCGGGGVSIGSGSVEGLSGTSDDGFGNLDNVGTPDTFALTNSLNALGSALANDVNNTLSQPLNSQYGSLPPAQSQIPPSIALAPSAGFVADAGTVTGIGLGTIIATTVVGAIGVLLPDSTASDDTTSDNSNVPVYRVVSPAELAYLQANGNYGSSPSQGGKYFALTAAGAQAFLSAPMNSDGTLTMTTLPGSVLSQGRAFPDIGPNGAGPSVWFSNPQLPLVYGTMTPPVVIPGN